MPRAVKVYCGRFAPSPTGPLHLGSLFTAVASWLSARAARGQWLLRIEDIDPPREPPSAIGRILSSLSTHGLVSDETVLLQRDRHEAYTAAVEYLLAAEHAFYCTCSRQDLAVAREQHPPQCANSRQSPGVPASIRVHMPADGYAFEDALLGHVDVPVTEDSFVIRRKDGLFAYHLAVVVDDAFQHISHVVRGRDLLDSTPYHLRLQRVLGLPTPVYSHLPLLLNDQGRKLSKQNLADPLDDDMAPDNLRFCLEALGQPRAPERLGDCASLLAWAVEHWDCSRVPRHDLPVTRQT